MGTYDKKFPGQFFDKGGAAYNVKHPDFGAVGDGETNDSAALAAAFAAGGKISLPEGSYVINSEVAYTGDLSIEAMGPVTLLCTSAETITSLLKVTGKLLMTGGPWTIDCDERAYLAVHCPTYLPEIENVCFKNTLGPAVLAGSDFSVDSEGTQTYPGTDGIGYGFLKNCRGENVGALAIARGDGQLTDTQFGFIECSTDENSGSATALFSVGAARRAYAWGGNYKGVSTTSPNFTQVEICEYHGGAYEGLLRGPTVGRDSTKISIVGGVSIGCDIGVSIDTRDPNTLEMPEVQGVVNWQTEGSLSRSLFLQGSGIYIERLESVNPAPGEDGTADVRLTDSKNVTIGKIIQRGAGAKRCLELGSGTDPTTPGSSARVLGRIQTDSTNVAPINLTSSESSLTYGAGHRVMTASGDLTLADEVVIVDASSGVVDLDLPGTSSAQEVVGKRWTIIVRDSTNNVTITRRNGGATAINGTSFYTIAAGTPYKRVQVESIGGGNYIVT